MSRQKLPAKLLYIEEPGLPAPPAQPPIDGTFGVVGPGERVAGPFNGKRLTRPPLPSEPDIERAFATVALVGRREAHHPLAERGIGEPARDFAVEHAALEAPIAAARPPLAGDHQHMPVAACLRARQEGF